MVLEKTLEQRKTKPHTWPGLLPAATELQVEGGLGCHLLVLLPAGSMRGQRQRGSAGLSDAGPGPSPTWANTQPREPHNWSRETRCDLHGGGREGLRAPEAAPCRRWHTGIEGHLRGHGEAGAGGSVKKIMIDLETQVILLYCKYSQLWDWMTHF